MSNVQSLSPFEFTELVRDLLNAAMEVRLSVSPEGPDGGIDILAAGELPQFSVVVQCKHYSKSKFASLKKSLSSEVQRIAKLNPLRYVIATSLELTVSQKKEIAALFGGQIRSLDDVLSLQDIQALLRVHPEIEKAHYKLWLGSTALLERILHRGTNVWESLLARRIEEHRRTFVQVPAFNEAIEILNRERLVVIVGGPGSGKTTLADVLCARFVEQGFTLFEILDLDEDIKGLPDAGDVVIYFDDFLGHVLFQDNQSGRGRRLERLFELVYRTDRFRLVLTSRTYLLDEGIRSNPGVERWHSNKQHCTVEAKSLDKGLRARLLYNHLVANDCPTDSCQSLTDWSTLKAILEHPNFAPRIIQVVAKSHGASAAKSRFGAYILDNLRNAAQLYDRVICEDISGSARDLLFALYELGPTTSIEWLDKRWRELRAGLASGKPNSIGFERCLKTTDDSLTHSSLNSKAAGGRTIEFFNPSVLDATRQALWKYDDRWLWMVENASHGDTLVALGECNSAFVGVPPWETVAEKISPTWISRWLDQERISTVDTEFELSWLGKAISLGFWNAYTSELIALLEAHRDKESDPDWTYLCEQTRHVPDCIKTALQPLDWLADCLRNDAESSHRRTSDADVLVSCRDQLQELGPVSGAAVHAVEEHIRSEIERRFSNLDSQDEIREFEFRELKELCDAVVEDYDEVLAKLEPKVVSVTAGTIKLVEPTEKAASLSDIEIQHLFGSLAARHLEASTLPTQEEKLPCCVSQKKDANRRSASSKHGSSC